MKKYIFLSVYILQSFLLSAQEKVAYIKVDAGFTTSDFSVAYYDQYDKKVLVNLLDNKKFTRLRLDTNFNVVDSYSLVKADISLNPRDFDKPRYLSEIVLQEGIYETYSNKKKVQIIKPDFLLKKDSVVFEYAIGQLAKDESLVAVFPGNNKIQILTSSFKSDKLFLTTWSPLTKDPVAVSFYLPHSNLTPQEEKETANEARIKFNKSITNLSVQPVNETSLMGTGGSRLYYSDTLVYLLLDIPYDQGVYLMTLNLLTQSVKGDNYFVNTYADNSSMVASKHRIASGTLHDSLLIIKNTSDKTLEYYFYNIKNEVLLKKYKVNTDNVETIVNSAVRQKGTWGSSKELKEFDENKKYLRKGGSGLVTIASVAADSITLTNMSLIPTTGIAGTLLDIFVPLQLQSLGVPYYATALLPPLGPSRVKMVYFHSKFSIKDFSPSSNKTVNTAIDNLLDDKRIETLTTNSAFVIKRNNTYYIGFYSKDSKNVEVYKYNAG